MLSVQYLVNFLEDDHVSHVIITEDPRPDSRHHLTVLHRLGTIRKESHQNLHTHTVDSDISTPKKQQSTEEASTPNFGRGAETELKTTMHYLTATVRTLPSIVGLQTYGVRRTKRHLYKLWSFSSKKTQPARGWNATDICTNYVYSTLAPEMGTDSVFGTSRPFLPAAWLALLLTKAGGIESNPGPTTHTNKHIPVIWICELCHKQIKKQQPTIRCNHTLNTHWFHLNCTQIKQRQYKPDWRCTIHTPT